MKKSICIVLIVLLLLLPASAAFAENDATASEVAAFTEGEKVYEPMGAEQASNAEPQREIAQLPTVNVDFPVGAVDIETNSANPMQSSKSTSLLQKSLDGLTMLEAEPTTMRLGETDIVSVVNKMDNPGTIKYLLVTLQPNQILQATLESLTVPQVAEGADRNAVYDYDLLLYDVINNGFANELDRSDLAPFFHSINGATRTVDEGVSVINETGSPKTYGLIVQASALNDLNSDYLFRLRYTIDSANNAEFREYDQNPFHPCADMYPGQYADQVKMNSPIDNDWFGFIVPEDTSYFMVRTILTNSHYNYELYILRDDNVSLEIIEPSAINKYELTQGTYYLRVFPNISGFVPGEYVMNTTLENLITLPMGITIIGYDSENGPNDYPVYFSQKEEAFIRGYRFKGDTLTVKAQLVDANGNASLMNDIELVANWYSGGWPSGNLSYNRKSESKTDDNGVATIILTNMPVAIGKIPYFIEGPQCWTHYYDEDTVIVTPKSEKLAFLGQGRDEHVFHFAYSIFEGME